MSLTAPGPGRRCRRYVQRAGAAAAVLCLAAAVGCDGAGRGAGDDGGEDAPVHPVWAAVLGGAGSYEEPISVAAAPDGRFAVVGTFSAGGAAGTSTFAGDGSVDGFLAVFEPDGRLAWSRTLVGPGEDSLTAVRFLGADALVVGGYVAQEGVLADRGLAVPAAVSALVARFSRDGELVWAQTFGGTGYQGTTHLGTSARGGILVTGDFSDTIVLERELTSTGSTDIFVAELDPSGAVLSSRAVTGAGTETVRAALAEPDGRIMVVGTSSTPLATDAATVPGHGVERAFAVGFEGDTATVAWEVASITAGTHSHVEGQPVPIVLERPELMARGASGETVVGVTRGELFGPHGGDLDTPALGSALLVGFDAGGTSRWRADLLGHEALIQLAAPAPEPPVGRIVGSFTGGIKIGSVAYLRGTGGRSLFVMDLAAGGGIAAARLVEVGRSAAGGGGRLAQAVGLTAIGSDVAPDGSMLVAASVAHGGGDRDALVFRLAPAPR